MVCFIRQKKLRKEFQKLMETILKTSSEVMVCNKPSDDPPYSSCGSKRRNPFPSEDQRSMPILTEGNKWVTIQRNMSSDTVSTMATTSSEEKGSYDPRDPREVVKSVSGLFLRWENLNFTTMPPEEFLQKVLVHRGYSADLIIPSKGVRRYFI